VTARKLRDWHGVKPVVAPAGVAITTRLRTTAADDQVLDLVAGHLGRLRRADLAAVSRQAPLDAGARHQARKDWLNNRKAALTAQSSSRWASAIIRGNDEQCRLARRNQEQRRLQHLKAELRQVTADYDAGRAWVTEGGRRLARTRHSLSAAGLTPGQWRERWNAARWLIRANGSPDEPFGNLTITVTPAGQASLRLPRPLEHLANAKNGRYILSGRARFSYRTDEWAARIVGKQSISYKITRRPGRAGVYLTASWATSRTPAPMGEARAAGPVIGVDLNDGHLAVRRLDDCGNPAGAPVRINFTLDGTAGRNDAQVRHAVTNLIHYARRHAVTTIAVEDLDFTDARDAGRETMGRGQRGKRFRRTVVGISTAVFRSRLAGQAANNGITLIAVNPAYTSIWGDQHWRKPYKNVTRHQAAATVIGRRAQGHKARRRESVTRTRPEDHVVRATDQAGPCGTRATASRHQARMRGTKSRPPTWHETRSAGRATVTPATVGRNDQLRT